MLINRSRIIRVLVASFLLAWLPVSPANATNCDPITGTSLTSNSNLWILQWDAISDTSNIDGVYIFLQSGSGYQSWYNNADGYFYGTAATNGSVYLVNKLGLVWFMNERDLTSVRFVIRKDNGSQSCYPTTTIGTVTPNQLNPATSINLTDLTQTSARLNFSSDYSWATQRATLTPTAGGSPIVINSVVSGTEITGLTPSTEYSVQIRTFGGLGGINSFSTPITFRTLSIPVPDPVQIDSVLSTPESAVVKLDPTSNSSTLEISGAFSRPIVRIFLNNKVLEKELWSQEKDRLFITVPKGTPSGPVTLDIYNGAVPVISYTVSSYLAATPESSKSVAVPQKRPSLVCTKEGRFFTPTAKRCPKGWSPVPSSTTP